MPYKNIETQMTEAIESLETYFQEKGIDPYEDLKERAQAIYQDNPGTPIEFPEWVRGLTDDEKKALSYLWSVAVRMKGYAYPELEYKVGKIFNVEGRKEFLGLYQRLKSSRSDKH